ncbi:hypothetical protein SK803_29695 [Lentzea sp. BCCO 10_0856]|uniref:Extracellular repeat, HAF family n=1 Tax=Lentzea miocenica TaxID=3095431 RepID=A0ABU4T8B8_9PSEU|nr:hypothetical protein [Lentzea sp. BCCO 10_0856]MDX8034411.1 hypothetical protein [Lentzea sp. BCCO 10_0856]
MKTLLIAALAASTLLAPAPASAAACTWTSADLPLPASTNFSAITGAAADGSYVLGLGVAQPWQDVALLWHNGSVESVPLAPGQFPNDVNASGTVLTNSSEGRAHRGDVELDPLPGANSAWAAAINAAGVAVGRSGSQMVTWPADSSVPQAVSGTDDNASWTVAGIDEQGRVAAWRYGLAEEPTLSYVWAENGVRTLLRPLRGHSDTRVNGIRNGRIIGFSASDGWTDQVGVEWDLRGNVVRALTGSADATDITSSGDALGRTADDLANVWRVNGDVEQPPATAVYEEFADDGSLYGGSYNEGTYNPVRASCA